MEELMKHETVRKKIKGLSPPVKKAFIESLLDLYEQETEEMIDVIEESRMELRGDYMSFEDESKNLRAESRMLEEKRRDGIFDGDDMSLKSRNQSRNDSRVSYVDEQINSKSVKDYLKNRGKRRIPLADQIKRSQSTDSSRGIRSISSMTTRSLPTPVSMRTVEEEKDEVMKNLTTANRQNEAERQRQMELIEERRAKRRQQKQTTEEKALELLEKAVAMDKMLAERKKEQEDKVRERLEDAKRKRAESRIGGDLVETDKQADVRERDNDRTSERRDERKGDDRRTDSRTDTSSTRDKDTVRKTADRSDARRADDKRSDRDNEKREREKDRERVDRLKSAERERGGSRERSDRSEKSDKKRDADRKERKDKEKDKGRDKRSKDTSSGVKVEDYDFAIY